MNKQRTSLLISTGFRTWANSKESEQHSRLIRAIFTAIVFGNYQKHGTAGLLRYWEENGQSSTWTYGLESEDEDHGMKTPSNPATPATPNTPNTPASDETDRSAFSVSMDSGIESPQGFQMPNQQLQSLGPLQPVIPTPGRPALSASSAKAAAKQHDHTTKEKLRRERIKDSCDQLRVLLPYIRGRKTDMASILEMCVDYLQIVNTVMPQSLHNQIVDILSKDPSLVPNKDMKMPKSRKPSKEMDSPSVSRVTSTVDSRGSSPASQLMNGDIKKPRPSVITFQAQDVTKREISDVHPMMSDKANKRLRLGSDGTLLPGTEDSFPHNTLSLSAGQIDSGAPHNTCSLAAADDDFGLFNTAQKPGLHTKSAFSDVNAYGRSYSLPSTEPFGTQLYNTYATAKSQTLERDSYQVYMDAPLYRYYYGGVGASTQSGLFSETMDYVNPNSVLSTASYGSSSSSSSNGGSTRLKMEGGEVIEDLNTPGNDKVEVTIIENSP